MKLKCKMIITGLTFLFVIFGIWNLYWYFNAYHFYEGFVTMKNGKEIPQDPLDSYSKIIGDYSVSVEMPSYLVMEGNLSVCHVGGDDSDPFLIIWPKRNGKTMYGIGLNSEYDIQQQLYVDEKGRLIPTINAEDIIEEQKEELNRHQKEVKNLLEVAHDTWNLKY